MRISKALLGSTALFVLGSMPQLANAQLESCVATYTDFNVDTVQGEVEAWAWVEDYFDDGGYCSQAVSSWGYFEHSYFASVSIESPTQNSAYDDDELWYIPYGGESAEGSTAISYIGDPGEYIIEWFILLGCSVGGTLVYQLDDDVVEVPLYVGYDEWPTDECGLSGDDYGPSHRGKDLNASAYSTDVKTMEDGTVTFVKDDGAHLGSENFVVVRGSDGMYTLYVHVTASVEVNDMVSAGDKIGVTDNTGSPSGPHVHICRSSVQGCSQGVDFELPVCPL